MATCRDSGFARTLDEGTITNKHEFQSCDRSEKHNCPYLIPLSTVNPAEFSLKIKTLGRVASRSKVWVPFFNYASGPDFVPWASGYGVQLQNTVPLISYSSSFAPGQLQLGYSGEPLPDISGLIEV